MVHNEQSYGMGQQFNNKVLSSENLTSIDLSDPNPALSDKHTANENPFVSPFDDEYAVPQQITQENLAIPNKTILSRDIQRKTPPLLSLPVEFKQRFETQRKARLGANGTPNLGRNGERIDNGNTASAIPIRSTAAPVIATTTLSTRMKSIYGANRFSLLGIGFIIVCLIVPLLATLGYFWSVQFKENPYIGSTQSHIFVAGFLLLGPLTLALIALHYSKAFDDSSFALQKPWIQCFTWTHGFMCVCCVVSIGLWLGMYNDVENTEIRIVYLEGYSHYLPYRMGIGWFVSLLLLLLTRKSLLFWFTGHHSTQEAR